MAALLTGGLSFGLTRGFVAAARRRKRTRAKSAYLLASLGYTSNVIKDYLIPHRGNNHKPKLLHPRSLSVIVLALVMLKIMVTAGLFFIYPNEGMMSQLVSQDVLELINATRVEQGLAPLAIDSALSAAALAKAEDMMARGYFSHQSPNGRMPWDWIDRTSYQYVSAGENLAMNFTSASAAHQALLQSPTHRDNIIDPRYSDAGLAVVSGDFNGQPATLLVELFASKKTKVAKTAPRPGPAAIKITPQKPAAGAIGAKETTSAAILESETAYVAALSTVTPALLGTKNEKNINAGVNQPDLAAQYKNAVPQVVSVSDESLAGRFTMLVIVAQYVFIAMLIVMVVALLLNIFIRITIQHKSVIIQTAVTIIIIASLISLHMHFLEGVSQRVVVL